ncbi:hypothetical protein [Paludisphaera borealis]|uniref:Uncharacterized protein n=1 Tax=Paludisphaera borealis TaxID=1387353 RepID=A0A1U7CY31_9BACT|nr:hypothetical protein [Paludisphaera borealis]APW63854.1 hypothetical protein BSF38_05434 [Paludisphaera borealis]
MGQISDELIKRLGRGRNLADEHRHEAGSIQAALDALKNSAIIIRLSPVVALDPLHVVYVALQNVTSVFAGRVSRFPEFKPYYQSAAEAESEHMPGGQARSRLSQRR